MSDILIKGMEMPVPGAYTCELGVLDNNTAVLTIYTPIDEPQRSYRLVSVPPHGRLIDASEKIKVQIYDDMTEDYYMVDMTIDDLLSQGWVEANAPTIIPVKEE